MKLIKADGIVDAWRKGCAHLLSQRDWTDTTVILNIENPMVMRDGESEIADKLDKFLVEHDSYSNHTVAETIFPGYEYKRRGVKGVYEVYPDVIFPRLRQDIPEVRRWGTYAHRLLRAIDKNGKTYNPLEYCIKKMRDKRPKRAAYELGFGFGFDLATYDDTRDRGSRLGGPCLSHLSFKVVDGRVHLTALYRSHYYVQRAYGNLLGLSRLLAFVAAQAGFAPGTMVCHSTMGMLDHEKWSKTSVEALLAECAICREVL
ncbi:MAG: hypothetical protein J0L92_19125 [Deltaproteobacteria bacterium]|nr:hypothetical protein [Deltaproteobacteria bacterium]